MVGHANIAHQRSFTLDDFVGTAVANMGLAVSAAAAQNKILQRTDATNAAVAL